MPEPVPTRRHAVTLIPGDGTGPELTEATRRCLEATGVAFEWDVQTAGESVLRSEGTPLPERVLVSIRARKTALKGPISTPVGSGFRSVNVSLRTALDLYACVRPCRSRRGVRSRYQQVDLVVIRENTEDLYAGIEFDGGSPSGTMVREAIERAGGPRLAADSALSIKPISASASERIVRFAFEYALRKHRRLVTAVHKANIMKATDGLFLQAARRVAAEYEGRLAFQDRIVDNMTMQLVQHPEAYDVIVAPNLYGDILSDLCAGLVGGLGVAPGANIGDRGALFEAVHGSAPKYTGQNRMNPTAMILSGVLMLEYLGEDDAARRLAEAVDAVIAEGREVTYDLKPDRGDPTAVGTREMADAIIRRLTGRVAVAARPQP